MFLIALACGKPIINNTSSGEFRVSSAALHFGEVYVEERASLPLQVSNTGTTAISARLPLDPPFELSQGELTLPGGASAELNVSFAPTTEGLFEVTLRIGTTPVTLRGKALSKLECKEPPNRCASSIFDPGTGQCVTGNKPDGVSCASVCMVAGSCSNGSCVGTLASCNDNNACTDDGCNEERGCVHTPKGCPGSTTNKCQAPACDPVRGCLLVDALDGTSCGPRNCRNNTTQVCIAAQCVERPLPTHECLNLFAYVKASNADPFDAFGSRLAVSADGSTLAVGSFVESSGAKGIDGNQNDNSAPQSGAVYIFRRETGAWVQEAYLKASNAGAGDSFGFSVALSSDGNTLVVGAHLEDSAATNIDGNSADNSAQDSGAAYVFQRIGRTWEQQAYLKASNTEPSDQFGGTLAVSADGNLVAVGASGEDSNATGLEGDQLNNEAKESGAVYLFRRTGAEWLREAYVKASTVQTGDQFGYAIALAPDASTIAVGAPGEDSKATGINGAQGDNSEKQSGAVFVFRRAATWTQEAYLKASNTQHNDAFGTSVSISFDGNTLAVGAYGEDSSDTGVNKNQNDNSAQQSGAAYVFRRLFTSWAQEAYLKASNTQLGDDFGFSVALSGDGKTLAVGAWSENSSSTGVDGHQFNNNAPDSGAIFFFRRSATTWAQDAYLKQSNTDSGDVFGYSLAISSDGNTLVSAALGEDSAARGINGTQSDNSSVDSGAVYIFSTQ